MSAFTIDDLVRLLRECAGEDEAVNLDGNIRDSTLEELGYDSLAVLNTVGRIERDYSVRLPEDVVSELLTPTDFTTEINRHLERSA